MERIIELFNGEDIKNLLSSCDDVNCIEKIEKFSDDGVVGILKIIPKEGVKLSYKIADKDSIIINELFSKQKMKIYQKCRIVGYSKCEESLYYIEIAYIGFESLTSLNKNFQYLNNARLLSDFMNQLTDGCSIDTYKIINKYIFNLNDIIDKNSCNISCYLGDTGYKLVCLFDDLCQIKDITINVTTFHIKKGVEEYTLISLDELAKMLYERLDILSIHITNGKVSIGIR